MKHLVDEEQQENSSSDTDKETGSRIAAGRVNQPSENSDQLREEEDSGEEREFCVMCALRIQSFCQVMC